MNYFLLLIILGLNFLCSAGEHRGRTDNTPENILKRRGELIFPVNPELDEEIQLNFSSEMRKEKKELEKIKYYLLNGELRLASVFLSNLSYTQSELRPTIYRYLAILSFIQEDFEKTYEYLSLKELQEIPEFGKICLLKTLTEIVLNRVDTVGKTWSKCRANNARYITDNYLIWPEIMVQFKLQPQGMMTKTPIEEYRLGLLSNEDTKIILKMALFLNQEDLILKQISELTFIQLQDTEIRELVGQIYFRKGYLVGSYQFIEDLTSPNALNIVGNLHLMKKNYEKAYQQFKLTLEKKPNSQNALERILPLAWILGEWESAFNYAHTLPSSVETIANKLTLLAAFSLQKADYESSEKYLQKILGNTRQGERLEVTQLAGFTELMQKDNERAKKYSWASCRDNDLINCWLLFQFSQWENFSLTIKRDEIINHKAEWKTLIEKEVEQPLKEKVFINQLDVEELDDKLINLIKNP